MLQDYIKGLFTDRSDGVVWEEADISDIMK